MVVNIFIDVVCSFVVIVDVGLMFCVVDCVFVS